MTKKTYYGVSRATRRRRLNKLADLLLADACNKHGVKFDMECWGFVADPKDPVSCGTQCCALGLAALSGAFARAGLNAKIKQNFVSFTFNGRTQHNAFLAGAKTFGISVGEAEHLFSPNTYPEFMSPLDDFTCPDPGSVRPGEGAEAERVVAERVRKMAKL